jgi:hypothetical protein
MEGSSGPSDETATPSGDSPLPLSREDDALLDELEAEIGDIDEHEARETLTLEAKARSVSPALARVVVALIGLGIATALSLGLTEPAQLRTVAHEDLQGVHSVSVPPPRAIAP